MALRPTIYSSISRAIGSTVLGGGFSGLLDSYPGAAAAYSLRALSSNWLAGDVVNVRRSSDNAEQAFTANQVASGELAAFCGTGDGFVATWYDQSGNGRDATQSTATLQPRVVIAGTVVARGLDFDGVDDYLSSPTLDLTQPFTSFSVSLIRVVASAGIFALGAGIGDGGPSYIDFYRSDNGFAVNAKSTLTSAPSNTYATDVQYLKTSLFDSANSEVYRDGSVVINGNAGSNSAVSESILIGRWSSNAMNGCISEIIIYDSGQSANRAGIENNINGYYGTY